MATLHLAPDGTAARRARAFVAEALAAHGLDPVVDTARLLTSELVTNAVVHTASRVEVALDVDGGGAVTVAVGDADTGPVGAQPSTVAGEAAEGGRGLLLVARLADAWGTEHAGGHKRIWFTLGALPRPAPSSPSPASLPAPTPVAGPCTLDALVLDPALAGALTFGEHLTEVLERVVAATGAAGCEVRVGDDDEPAARVGAGSPTWTEELAVDGRRLGSFSVLGDPAPGAADRAFVHLAAQRLALLCLGQLTADVADRRGDELRYMAEATEMLAGSTSVSRTLTLASQLVVPRLAEWCASYTVTAGRGSALVTVNHRREELLDELGAMARGDAELLACVAAAVTTGQPQRMGTMVSVGGSRTHVLAQPLVSRQRLVGVLLVARARTPDPATSSELAELSRRIALAADNALLHEERSTATAALQAALLPSALPDLAGLDLAARYHSASPGLAVGGDFYDAFELPDGTVALVVGDVCGKGAEAAIVTGTSRDLLRLLLLDGSAPATALRRLNRALAEHPSVSRFCTIAVVLLRRHRAGATATVCLAGHPEPVVTRADGTMQLIGEAGSLIGLLDDAELRLTEVEVDLRQSDAVVLYTDGVTERRNGAQLFGQTGLMRSLGATRALSADSIAGVVEDAVRSYVDDDLRDDFAVMVARLG